MRTALLCVPALAVVTLGCPDVPIGEITETEPKDDEGGSTTSGDNEPTTGAVDSTDTGTSGTTSTDTTNGETGTSGATLEGSGTTGAASCGDGVVDDGEDCDDGNDDETDACLSTCVAASCGDGHVQADVEPCDDGNNVDGDGCTAACVVQVCGDGVVQDGEACDDGNDSNDDTCTVTCVSNCGDGVLQQGEACDDGDVVDDACSPGCVVQEVLEVVHGMDHMCARLTGGVVKCWGGNNLAGQLGLGDKENRGDQPGEMGAALPAVDLGAGQIAVALSVGQSFTCALLAGGRVKCWGWNGQGELGLGDSNTRGDEPGEMGDNLPFADLGPGFTATTITSGGGHTCALSDAGRVKCWGWNTGGQLGLGDTVHRGIVPDQMGELLPFVDLGVDVKAVALAAGNTHTCALLTDGGVKCWGTNGWGTLGLGDTEKRGDEPGEMGDALPLVDLGFKATALTAGSLHTCAIDELGRIKCWGSNSFGGQFNPGGELGLGDTENRGDAPGEMGQALPFVDLGAGNFATAVNASHYHTCALVNDGLKCWGRGAFGALGLGDGETRGDQPGEMGDALPTVDLGPGVSIASLGRGSDISWSSCALLTDGSVKCWGSNGVIKMGGGKLGQGDLEDRGDEPGEMGDALARIKLFSDNW